MDKILITGGAGFIGSLVNKMLNQAGFETVVLDNLSRGDSSTVVAGTFVEGDIGDEKLLDKLFKKHSFAAVMHFASLIEVGESVKNPAPYYANNLGKTLILLNKMREHGVNTIVFSSTAAVYGIPLQIPINEDHPTDPINPYGRTKLMVEQMLQELDFKYASLRYFNAAGGDPDGAIKTHSLKPVNLIPLLFSNIEKGDAPFTINGNDYDTRDGTCVRDFIHIYDLGDAHIKALQHLLEGNNSEIFNIGNGSGFTVSEVATTVEMVTGHSIKIVYGPRREGDPPVLVANPSKIKTTLGWKPKYPDLGTIVRHAWQAWRKT